VFFKPITMWGPRSASTLFWAVSFSDLVLSRSTPSPPLDVSVRTRNLPGQSDADTFLEIRRRFADVTLRGTTVADGKITLDRSWEDTPLFSS